MNKKHWLQLLQLADDRYVEEAIAPMLRKKKRWPGVLAACLCCVLAAGLLFLFLPYGSQQPDTAQFRESEYYGLIQVLSRMNYQEPEYENNYEMLRYVLTSKDNMEMAVEDSIQWEGAGISSVPESPESAPQYQEITDNQVSGITEADRIKRTDQYIYYLDGDTLRVYTIAGEATQNVGSFCISDTVKAGMDLQEQWEFYLSQDGTRVNVIAPCLDADNRRQVKVVCLDVSDPGNIRVVNQFGVSGQNLSSRVVGDSLLLMTKYRSAAQEMDFSDETTFLPQISCGGETKSIPADKIVIPEEPISSTYVVIMKLDMDTLQMRDCVALLSFTEKLYVSQERIYAACEYTQSTSEDCSTAMTQIVGIDYSGDSFGTGESIAQASVHLEGYVKDQYSMDELDGILRVVTTTRKTESVSYEITGVESESVVSVSSRTSANLYCVDLNSWEIVGKAEQFAPEGETVRSVRFDGTSAYVCTAVELTDPVFFFDLSDVENITYKDTGNIEGFSSSLVDFGNGYLLGIGSGSAWDTLKIEVYGESTQQVESICSYELEKVTYSEQYKSYYIDRQNQLVGLGYMDESGNSRYLVLLFDGYAWNVMIDTALSGTPEMMRGVYIAEWFYLFGSEEFKTETLFS